MSTLAAETPASADVGAVNRMSIAVLALAGLLLSTYMTLYAFGVIGDLTCGVGGGCETVQHSSWARLFGVPVALIGVGGYGALFVAALLGLQPRFAARPAVPRVLLGGAILGLTFTAYLTYLEAFVIHAWCRWCLVSAGIAVLIFLAALPELRQLRRQA